MGVFYISERTLNIHVVILLLIYGKKLCYYFTRGVSVYYRHTKQLVAFLFSKGFNRNL